MRSERRLELIGTGLLLCLVFASPVGTQQVTPVAAQATDARWTAWLGCWELVDEDLTAARLAGLDAIDAAGERRSTSRPRDVEVCVTPAEQGAGVKLTTTVGSRRALEEILIADATERPFSEGDCRGWQRAEWSKNVPRLFTRAELTCAGQPPRTVAGFAMMESLDTWLDIQVVETAGRVSTRVRRYRPIASESAPARRAAARTAAGPLTIGDVIEASAKLPARAVEAALIETDARFNLTGQRLIELDDAGVADEVTDLMVALSFRDRFVVDRGARGGASGGFSGWSDPFLYSYYYAPFAYSYLGYFDPYYYNGPGYIIIDPDEGGSVDPQPSGAGRVVDGRGYTRVRPRETSPGNAGGSPTGSSGQSTSSGGSGGSSSGSSGGVSTQGYSGGGSSGGGRTAQPRPPK
jgi:hypothetical protein